jgi:hypothetical protein
LLVQIDRATASKSSESFKKFFAGKQIFFLAVRCGSPVATLPVTKANQFGIDLAEGRDIALRCPRPRRAGGTSCREARITSHVAPLVRGADGAARRPYQGQFWVLLTNSHPPAWQ